MRSHRVKKVKTLAWLGTSWRGQRTAVYLFSQWYLFISEPEKSKVTSLKSPKMFGSVVCLFQVILVPVPAVLTQRGICLCPVSTGPYWWYFPANATEEGLFQCTEKTDDLFVCKIQISWLFKYMQKYIACESYLFLVLWKILHLKWLTPQGRTCHHVSLRMWAPVSRWVGHSSYRWRKIQRAPIDRWKKLG